MIDDISNYFVVLVIAIGLFSLTHAFSIGVNHKIDEEK